ncbi:MAG: helix-turn-helix domain-containing protein [Parachlamydiaceae bacterium]
MDRKKTSNAVSILHRRYIKDDPKRKESVEVERLNARVARMIYDLRTQANLNQGELANLVGTTQSVISRLEDSDYDGHSLSMLERITEKLGQQIRVISLPQVPEAEKLHSTFQTFVTNLRRRKGLSREDLAQKLDVDAADIAALEQSIEYRASPRLLHNLSRFYEIPERKLYALAGATKEISTNLQQEASKFAAKSDSFSKLTSEEKHLLDEFLKFLKTEED